MDRRDRFRCTVLSCTLTAGACADRQRDAAVSRARNATASVAARVSTPFLSCRNCEQGRAIVAEIGASPKRGERLVTQAPMPVSPASAPKTRAERVKVARALGLELAREARIARTHCPRGHEYTGTDGRGARVCRVCIRAATARHRERRRDGKANTRTPRGPLYTLPDGRSLSLAQLAVETGLPFATLQWRLQRKRWPVERAVSEPVASRKARAA